MMSLRSSRTLSLLVLAVLGLGPALAGCGRTATADSRTPANTAGAYLSPPTLSGAVRVADGGVSLSGQAPAGSLVRLRSPDGAQASTRAGDGGAWSLDLPPTDAPRLYAFEAEADGQVLRGEGALAVVPALGSGAATPAALVLRAGYAAAPTGAGPAGRLQLVALDYDGGGAAAGGFAPPRSPVRLTVDGGKVGVAMADAQGRFAILDTDPSSGVPPGRHLVRVDTPQGLAVEQTLDLQAPPPPDDRAFAAVRTDTGWRVSWRLPGGGTQTSLVFDNAVSAPPAPPPAAPALRTAAAPAKGAP